jgi:hypothetical protein
MFREHYRSGLAPCTRERLAFWGEGLRYAYPIQDPGEFIPLFQRLDDVDDRPSQRGYQEWRFGR